MGKAKRNKVFCKYCKYVRDAWDVTIPTNCGYLKNIIGKDEDNRDSFFEPHELQKVLYRNIASDINKNNDCKWFKISFWKGWS